MSAAFVVQEALHAPRNVVPKTDIPAPGVEQVGNGRDIPAQSAEPSVEKPVGPSMGRKERMFAVETRSRVTERSEGAVRIEKTQGKPVPGETHRFQPDPREREPVVEIQNLEVVVEAPAAPRPVASALPLPRPGLSDSRSYLRTL